LYRSLESVLMDFWEDIQSGSICHSHASRLANYINGCTFLKAFVGLLLVVDTYMAFVIILTAFGYAAGRVLRSPVQSFVTWGDVAALSSKLFPFLSRPKAMFETCKVLIKGVYDMRRRDLLNDEVVAHLCRCFESVSDLAYACIQQNGTEVSEQKESPEFVSMVSDKLYC
jgi:hypothetical protein